MQSLLILLTAVVAVQGNMYDMFFPSFAPADGCTCLPWASAGNSSFQPKIAAMFAEGKVPTEASNHCAMPAASAGAHECDCADSKEVIFDSFAGPWCFCAGAEASLTSAKYCTAPKSHVLQLNLQVAGPDVVVASFVTYEALPTNPPEAMLGTDPNAMSLVKGVSHYYQPPNRTYVLSFVKFGNLKPRTKYYYKVRSGSDACEWSDVYEFRSGYSSGITRVATYGDMGHSHYNNMGNLKDDCASGAIDGVVHMGDHCYNMGMVDDRRGDAYMNAFQPAIATCPWFPIIGNHEAADGDHFNRYLNQTWGEVYGNEPPVHSSATSALGHLLSKATLYGAGVHGSTPSQTSRYVSVDFGLIHMVGLDLNNLDDDQVAWLEADLAKANANRAAVPWVMVMSHFPIYHSLVATHGSSSARHYRGDESEEVATEGHEFFPCDSEGCETVEDFHNTLANALDPILIKYGVDIYNAGHVHDYEATYPMCGDKSCQHNYTNPMGPVHICEGNGGVPGVAGATTLKNCSDTKEWCRVHGTGGAYGRITAFNATHLQYEHVTNNGSRVEDSFMIVQDHHGPFPQLY